MGDIEGWRRRHRLWLLTQALIYFFIRLTLIMLFLICQHPPCPPYQGGLGGRRLRIFRDGLIRFPSKALPDFESHRKLSEELTKRAIKVSGEIKIKGKPFLIVLSDEEKPPHPPLLKGGWGFFRQCPC